MLMIMLYTPAHDILISLGFCFVVSLLFGCRFLSVAVNIETVTTVSAAAAAAAAFVRQIGHFGQRRCLYRLPVVESLAGLHR